MRGGVTMRRETRESAAHVLLATVWQLQAISSVVVDQRTVTDLSGSIATAELKLTTEQITRLEEVSKIPREYAGWAFEQLLADEFFVWRGLQEEPATHQS